MTRLHSPSITYLPYPSRNYDPTKQFSISAGRGVVAGGYQSPDVGAHGISGAGTSLGTLHGDLVENCRDSDETVVDLSGAATRVGRLDGRLVFPGNIVQYLNHAYSFGLDTDPARGIRLLSQLFPLLRF